MKRRLLLILLTLPMFAAAYAQGGESCAYPADPTLANPEAYKGFDCVVFADSTNVSVQETGSGSFAVCKTFKVLTPKGAVDNRIIKYGYDPLTAFAKFKSVTIYRADGAVEELDLAKACDYVAPARMIYWGAREIMIELGRLEPGDIVEYEIDKKGFTYALLADGGGDDESRFIPPMRGSFYDIVPFWVDYPTVRKVYRLNLPTDKNLQFHFYQGSCQSSMDNEGGINVYTFANNDIAPFKKEPNMVDLYDAAPKLMMSTTPTWVDKSLWFNKVNEDYKSFAALPEAQKKVNEIIRGAKDEMEKIALLTHWVADNIRYSGISMGEGEGYTLHNTKMNFTDRCGVCKDIAGTLISFLRMAGFEAYPAMTMAGSRVEQIPADHFNHCVSVVKLSNGTYMPLDPTWVPFTRELWSSAEQQQNYLPGVPEGSDLQLTPVSAPENHYLRINAKNRIDEKGTLTGEFTVTAEGQSDAGVRRIFTRGWQTDWARSMERELLNVSPKARLVSVDYGNDPRNYQAGPIKITFKYVIPDYAIMGDGVMAFKPMTLNNLYASVQSFLRVNTNVAERKYGFRDSCSRLVEIKEDMKIPAGYTLSASRVDNSVSPVAKFNGSLSQKGDTISLNQSLALYKRIYNAEDWNGYSRAVKAYKSFGDYMTIVKKL
jgi:hypothetical protein